MRKILICTLLGAAFGCSSQRAEYARQQQAYVAGEQHALATQQAGPAGMTGPRVFVQGQVMNGVVPWVDGMSMSQAIVNARYTGFMNPSTVRVMRGGQVIQECKGVDLLKGTDMPLQPGDTVVLVQ